MSASGSIVAEIGHVYRVMRNRGKNGPLFTLEAFHEPYWYECQKWDDPGHVANLLVKHGVAADHASALELLSK